MKALRDCRLYAFVDSGYLHGRPPVELAKALCDGGADLIQYRAKGQTADDVRRVAEQLRPIVEAARVGLVINDHWQVACELGAPVCHLGQEDFFDAGLRHKRELPSPGGAPVSDPARGENLTKSVSSPCPPELKVPPLPALGHPLLHSEWRRGTGRGGAPVQREGTSMERDSIPLLGLSSHAPEQAQRALAAGADYIAIGPVFPTGTKPGRPAVTLDYVRWAAANVTIPWFAIGGITLENLDAILAAGATRICVVSAILNAPDVARACAEFRRRLPA